MADPNDSLENNEMIKEVSREIEKDPENAELYYRRAIGYFNLKYLDRAIADIDDAILKNGNNPLYHYQKGRICYAMNRTKEAEKAYLAAIRLKPDYDEANMKLAELYYLVKKHRESMDLLNTIIQHQPNNGEAYFFRGMNYKEVGDTGKAIASFQRALENESGYYDAVMQIGYLYAARKDKTALNYFNEAVKMRKRSSEAYFARGYYYQNMGEYQKALNDYRKVIDIEPENNMAYYNVGCINFDVKQYKEALRSFDICIQMGSNIPQAFYMRGLIYEMNGNKEEARMNYRQTLDLYPGYGPAEERLKGMK